jgi:hypothetical protein
VSAITVIDVDVIKLSDGCDGTVSVSGFRFRSTLKERETETIVTV